MKFGFCVMFALCSLLLAAPVAGDCTTVVVHHIDENGNIIPMHDADCDTTQQEIDDNLSLQTQLCPLAEDDETCEALLAESATAARDHIIKLELSKGTSVEDISALTGASAAEVAALQAAE